MGRKRVKKVKTEDLIENKAEEEVEVVNSFECNECHNKFVDEKEADNHILRQHYGLARINDPNNTPFAENEMIKALMRAQKLVKVLKCKNVDCNKSFKSGLGLKMHLDICGKSESELTTNCEICGKQLRISSVSIHMKTHIEKKRVLDNESDQSSGVNQRDGNKRASAIRASKCIKKVTKGEIIISGNVSDNELVSDSDNEYIPESTVNVEIVNVDSVVEKEDNLSETQIIKSILNIWKDFMISNKEYLRPLPPDHNWHYEVLNNGLVTCPLEDCKQEFKTKGGLEYHYRRCGLNLSFSWKCKICDFEVQRGSRPIVNHLWESHKDSLPALSDEIVSTIFLDLQNNSKIFRNDVKKNLNLIGTLSHVLQFHEIHFKDKAFTQWIPTIYSWSTLSEIENSIYIPSDDSSILFKSSTQPNSWRSLDLFESISTGNHITFFVGGPVWSSSWCPTPVNVVDCNQYLAIASTMNMETTHTYNDTEPETGIIQIWNMSQMTKQFDSEIKPLLALCIAHSYGMIWDMEWCPGGTAWEDIKGYENSELEILPRLGLLAVACGDGCVRIHSIPYPEALPQSYQNLMYRNEAVVVLNPPGVGISTNNEQTICKCLSWIKSNNQHLIVGGFGNGLISVWDLTTTSSLLIIKSETEQTVLRPRHSWFGHSAGVNGIKWVDNSSEQYIASCSFDRTTKLWNLKDLTIPVTVIKKGVFTAIDLHLQWCGVFMANDDCYLNFQNTTFFKDFGFFDFSPNSMTGHRTCIWDLSISEWTTATASVDAAGEAIILPNFQLRTESKSKKRNFDKIPLYHISPIPLSQNESNADPKDNIKFVINRSEPPIRSYNEFKSKYGLLFNDYPLTSIKSVPMQELNRIRLSTDMQYQRHSDYPIISLINVNWNQNFNSCTWIFTASQSGLCRITCVPCLDPISRTFS